MSKLPKAPAKLARVITELAQIKAEQRQLSARARSLVQRLAEHGSCRTDQWCAYVSHNSGGLVQYYKAPRTSVTLRPVKEDA